MSQLLNRSSLWCDIRVLARSRLICRRLFHRIFQVHKTIFSVSVSTEPISRVSIRNIRPSFQNATVSGRILFRPDEILLSLNAGVGRDTWPKEGWGLEQYFRLALTLSRADTCIWSEKNNQLTSGCGSAGKAIALNTRDIDVNIFSLILGVELQ